MRWLVFLIVGICAAQEEQLSSSARLMSDIMQIFAPKSETNYKTARTEPNSDSGTFGNLLPPFGLNRQLPDPDSMKQIPEKSASLAQTVASLFKPRQEQLLDDRHPLKPVGSDETASRARSLAGIAKDVMGLFGVQAPATTTTTPAPVFDGLQMFNPRFYQQLMPNWMQPLNPYTPQNSDQIRRSPERKNMFGDWTSVFDTQNPATQIDTGGNIFDRLVVRENMEQNDPIANFMGGKFNEKGIQWTDGNLKLVNKNGNKLLGSEIAVHDRSIDIPVQKWFDIAQNLATAYQNPEISLFPPPKKL